MINNLRDKEAAIIVVITIGDENRDKALALESELRSLAKTSGCEPIRAFHFHVRAISPRFFIGKGMLAELELAVSEEEPDLVIFGKDLRPSQQRNIEDVLRVKTIDRTQLILDIFALHASSMEGKRQVELAQLRYLLPRLTGKGILLSRLGGGIGTRGPGETKLEVDRRRIADRIKHLKRELKHYERHRETSRKRLRENLLQISLVGYTSAGKSSFMNAVANTEQEVSGELFTTLDSISRRIKLPDGRQAVLTDTVGFLDGLPHTLIEAFKATLEDVRYADGLLHIIDGSDPDWRRKSDAVMDVLRQIGASEKPIVTAINKIDLLSDRTELVFMKKRLANAVEISAKQSLNIKKLMERLSSALLPGYEYRTISLPISRPELVNVLYSRGRVDCVKYLEDKIEVKGFFKADMRIL